MRVNELMIGNWVKWFGNPCIVDLPLLKTEYSENEISSYIQPIPITEELLLKNGFVAETIHADECVVNYYELKLDNCKIVISDVSNKLGRDWTIHVDDDFRCSIASACVNYVHQMQNLLNIMDIEWEVKI